MKKLILSLGSAVAVIAPVVSVISCNNGGTGSKSSDKNTETNTSNSGVQSSEHKYPELTDSLRNELTLNNIITIRDFYNSKGGREYFKQFEAHTSDSDFKSNYLVIDPGQNR